MALKDHATSIKIAVIFLILGFLVTAYYFFAFHAVNSSPEDARATVEVASSTLERSGSPSAHDVPAGATDNLWKIHAPKTFFLPSDCAHTHSLITADNYIFGGIWSQSISSCIWRLNPNTGGIVYTTSSLSGVRVGGDHMLYDKARDTIYAIETNPATYILAINPRTLSATSYPINIDEPAMSLPSMTSDGSYFYAVNNTSYPADSLLYKISMDDYSIVATSILPGGNYHAITYDGHYLYMTSAYPGGYILKADMNLKIIDTSNYARSKLCNNYTNDMAETGGYLYLGCEIGFYGVRVDKDNFENHSLIYAGGSQFAATYNGKYILYATYSGVSYDKILVLDPATLKSFMVKVDDGSPNEIVDDGTNLFATIWKTNRIIMFSTIINSGGAMKVLSSKI